MQFVLWTLVLVLAASSSVKGGSHSGCSHGHKHGHDHGHDDHEHHDHEEKEQKAWKEMSVWKFEGKHVLLFCAKEGAPESITMALQPLDAKSDAAKEKASKKANEVFNGFDSIKYPHKEMRHLGTIAPNQTEGFNELYRVALTTQSNGKGHSHGHTHSHGQAHKHGHAHRALEAAECGGHGHLHGDHCHCDDGYAVNVLDRTICIVKSLRELNGCNRTIVLALDVKPPGLYALFTTETLKDAGLQVRNSKYEVVSLLETDRMEETLSTSNESPKWLYTLLACLLTSTTALLGVFVVAIKNKKVLKVLIKVMTSFATGSLLSTVIFHLYPESGHYLFNEDVLNALVLGGIVLGMFVEQGMHMLMHKHGVHHHHHDHDFGEELGETNEHLSHQGTCGSLQQKDHDASTTGAYLSQCSPAGAAELGAGAGKVEEELPSAVKPLENILDRVEPVAWIVGVGDFVHAFTDGVMIAVAFRSKTASVGWFVTLAVVMHEVPHRLGDFFIFLKAGMTLREAISFNLVVSLSTFLGAILLLSIGDVSNATLGCLLAFGSGTLLFIALCELLPMMLHEMKPTMVAINYAVFAVGVVTVYLLTKFFHPEH